MCLAYVLKGKTEKLEPHSELCLFVNYPKETRGGFFYNPQDSKVFVLTNATFLEDNYIRDHQPRSKVVIKEPLSDKVRPQQPTSVVGSQSQGTTLPRQNTPPPPKA